MRNLIFILLPLMAFASCSENSFESGTATPPNNQIWYKSTYSDVLLPNAEAEFGAKILSNTYENGKGVITFGDEVKYIGKYAFYECEGLKQIAIPNSVTEIEDGALEFCSNLTSVIIPNSVTAIGAHAFSGCSSLTAITIPNSATSIEWEAFYGCSSLTSITISNSVTEIGHSAFSGCSSLTSVTIGDSVTTIGNGAFYNCSSLKEFKGKFAADGGRCLIKDNTIIAYAEASGTTYTIPDSVTTIGNWAFYHCSSLTTITIPDSVTEIGYSAFYGCQSLTKAVIGSGVKKIDYFAFQNCIFLNEIICKPTTPPTGSSDMFNSIGTSAKIYVPVGSGAAYKAANYWRYYASMIEEKEM